MSEIRILHLDADPTFAETTQTRLKSLSPDHSVTWVRNQSGYRAALALGGFDLILSEFGLSGFPGLSILEDARKACPGIPFLFVSSFAKVEAAVDSLQAGADGYILKSDLEGMSRTVTRILKDILEFSGSEEETPALEDRPNHPRQIGPKSTGSLSDVSGKQYPLRILVAEDNEIGQMVICSLLENLGQRAKVVSNGKAAVEAYRESAYDLVLMDCHMPEMDGYEAVSLIRDLERKGGNRRALILAMTADVLPGTRERCIEWGMDGYISKPILMGSLEDMIGMAIAGAWQDAFHARESADALESGAAGDIDPGILDRLRLLSSGDVPGMFQELVSGYIEQSETKLEELHGHVEAEDSARIAGVAHGLKGLSLNFGALAMARECDTLQRHCEAGVEECRPILKRLRETKGRTNRALSNLAGLTAPENGLRITEPPP